MRPGLLALLMFGAVMECIVRPALAQAPASPAALEAEVKAQRVIIDQLQARLTALEQHAAPSAAKPVTGTPQTVRIEQTPAIAKPKLGDLGPDLQSFGERRLKFKQATAGATRPTPELPANGPSALQQLQTEQTQLAAELADLKNVVGFDQDYLFGSMTLLRDNLNAVGNSLSDLIDSMNQRRGLCTGMNTYTTLATLDLIKQQEGDYWKNIGQCFFMPEEPRKN
jgi:small-conductance mechanosensitive channel